MTAGPLEPPCEVRGLLRRELDWALLRAIDPDRSRRYSSVADFAEDLQRYLDGHALRSGPPSRWYVARKFVRRNRGPVAICSTSFMGLVGLAVGAFVAWQAEGAAAEDVRLALRKEAAARTAAERALEEAEAARQEAMAARDRAEESRSEAVTQATRSLRTKQFLADILNQITPRSARGRETALLKEILEDTAQRLPTELGEDRLSRLEMTAIVGSAYLQIGELEAALALVGPAAGEAQALLGVDHPVAIYNLSVLVKIRLGLGQLSECEQLARDLVERRRRESGVLAPPLLEAMSILARVLHARGHVEEGSKVAREVYDGWLEVHGPGHPKVLHAQHELAFEAHARGLDEEALRWITASYLGSVEALGLDHPETLSRRNSYGMFLYHTGALQRARLELEQALGGVSRVHGPQSVRTIEVMANLGMVTAELARR